MRMSMRLLGIILTLMCWGCHKEIAPGSEKPMFPLGPLEGRVIRTEDRISIDSPSVIQYPDQFVWGGSVVQGEDGRFHMFFSMFDAGPDNPPFSDAWLLSSKIAYAVSDKPDKGFVFQRVVLKGAKEEGRPDAWDAQAVHNPHIKKFNGMYYLYYIGSRDPGEEPEGSPGAFLRKRDRIQQVQKIGVIACQKLEDMISGRFTRPEVPLLSPRTRIKSDNVIDPSPSGTEVKPDNMVVVNPSVAYRPSDGKYLLFFKGNLYDPDWRGVHGVALGDSPAGPFTPLDIYVFDVRMPDGRLAKAEDPYVWYHNRHESFFAVFKDFSGRITGGKPGLALMRSKNGIDWEIPPNPLFSRLELRFSDGTVLPVAHLERPQLLIGDSGDPMAFYAACSIEPAGQKTDGTTFNVQMHFVEKK